MLKSKEVAKFLSGFEAFHAVFHAYLWASGTTFTALGYTTTTAWNAIGTVLHGAIAIALGVYGLRLPNPAAGRPN